MRSGEICLTLFSLVIVLQTVQISQKVLAYTGNLPEAYSITSTLYPEYKFPHDARRDVPHDFYVPKDLLVSPVGIHQSYQNEQAKIYSTDVSRAKHYQPSSQFTHKPKTPVEYKEAKRDTGKPKELNENIIQKATQKQAKLQSSEQLNLSSDFVGILYSALFLAGSLVILIGYTPKQSKVISVMNPQNQEEISLS